MHARDRSSHFTRHARAALFAHVGESRAYTGACFCRKRLCLPKEFRGYGKIDPREARVCGDLLSVACSVRERLAAGCTCASRPSIYGICGSLGKWVSIRPCARAGRRPVVYRGEHVGRENRSGNDERSDNRISPSGSEIEPEPNYRGLGRRILVYRGLRKSHRTHHDVGSDKYSVRTEPLRSFRSATDTSDRAQLRRGPTVPGAITEYALPSHGFPWRLVSGPDGAIWFTYRDIPKVGRISTNGAVAEFRRAAHPMTSSSAQTMRCGLPRRTIPSRG